MPNSDEHEAVGRIDDAAGQLDGAAQEHRRRHLQVVAAPDLQRDVADDEGDADREQHLRQMVLAGPADQEAVDQEAERDDREPAAERRRA